MYIQFNEFVMIYDLRNQEVLVEDFELDQNLEVKMNHREWWLRYWHSAGGRGGKPVTVGPTR